MPDTEPPPSMWSQAISPRKLALILVFASLLGMLFVWTFDQKSRSLLPANPEAPPGSLRLVVLVGVYALWAFANGLARRRARRAATRTPEGVRVKLRRPFAKAGQAYLFWQLALVYLVILRCPRTSWTYESVGFASEWPPLLAAGVGVFVYFAFAGILTFIFSDPSTLAPIADNNLRVMAGLWPRARRQKFFAVVAICALNPLTEELIFRGILVHQFALATGSLAMPLTVSLAATLGNHAYQGFLAWTTHVPFYLCVVGLLYSPAGLWGAVGFHLAGDILPVRGLKNSMRQYRKRHLRPSQATDRGGR